MEEVDYYQKMLTLTDEMKYDEENPAFGKTEFKAKMRYYRRQFVRIASALIAANAKIE